MFSFLMSISDNNLALLYKITSFKNKVNSEANLLISFPLLSNVSKNLIISTLLLSAIDLSNK